MSKSKSDEWLKFACEPFYESRPTTTCGRTVATAGGALRAALSLLAADEAGQRHRPAGSHRAPSRSAERALLLLQFRNPPKREVFASSVPMHVARVKKNESSARRAHPDKPTDLIDGLTDSRTHGLHSLLLNVYPTPARMDAG